MRVNYIIRPSISESLIFFENDTTTIEQVNMMSKQRILFKVLVTQRDYYLSGWVALVAIGITICC